MLYRVFLFLLINVFNGILSCYSQQNKSTLKKVIIKYESFTTMTSESVKCMYFEGTFKDSLKEIVIENSKELAILSHKVGAMISIDKKKSIDVRVKVILCYKHSEVEYCMDRFGVFVDSSENYLGNKYLYDFVIKHIPRRGW